MLFCQDTVLIIFIISAEFGKNLHQLFCKTINLHCQQALAAAFCYSRTCMQVSCLVHFFSCLPVQLLHYWNYAGKVILPAFVSLTLTWWKSLPICVLGDQTDCCLLTPRGSVVLLYTCQEKGHIHLTDFCTRNKLLQEIRSCEWLSCKIEDLSIPAAVKYISPFIIQSLDTTTVTPVSKLLFVNYEKMNS